MEIGINTSPDNGGIAIIEVEGRMDALSVGEFEEKVIPQCSAEGITGYIIDFAKLIYISSAGLRAILKVAKLCKEQGRKVAICNLAPEVHDVFKISGFDLIITVCENLDSAKSAVA